MIRAKEVLAAAHLSSHLSVIAEVTLQECPITITLRRITTPFTQHSGFQLYPEMLMDITVAAVVTTILSLMLAFAMVWRAAYRPWTKKPRIPPLTLRISNIPRNITEEEFRRILDLAGEINTSPGAADRPELLGWSCARSGHSERSFVATATFRVPPTPNQLESAIKRTMGVEAAQLRVDLDFFGLTPLADPQDPAVE
jgi:hypothetical protein